MAVASGDIDDGAIRIELPSFVIPAAGSRQLIVTAMPLTVADSRSAVLTRSLAGLGAAVVMSLGAACSSRSGFDQPTRAFVTAGDLEAWGAHTRIVAAVAGESGMGPRVCCW